MKKYQVVSIGFLIGVNIFWLGLNMRNNAVGTVFMPYLVERFTAPEIRNTALGAMRTAGLVIAMLVQPAIGLLSDRSTSRFGRRRPYLLIGVILDVLLLVWIGLAGNYWSLLAAVMIFQVSSNISHGALQALIPDLVPEANNAGLLRRSRLSSNCCRLSCWASPSHPWLEPGNSAGLWLQPVRCWSSS